MAKRVHVIVNPASGLERPVLHALNRAFHPAGIDWDVFVTKRDGDAHRYAEQALAAGVDVVAVYGGDGSVMEVASALIGKETPLAILPGGTANVVATELGIPSDLAAAAALICREPSHARAMDVGQVGDDYFLCRVGMGFEAQMVQGADRGLKDQVGSLAYFVSAMQALAEPDVARYRLTLDGQTVEVEALTCILANAGSFGAVPLSLAPDIDVSDGLLDVLRRWRAREVSVAVDPEHVVQLDGEVWGKTPITARVLPGAVRVLVPDHPTPRA